jgi:hypothetical protein
MKKLENTQVFRFKHIWLLIFILFLIGGSVAFAADEGDLKKGDVTTDGLTVTKSTRHTEKQIKDGVDWSEYTKYQITPVEVSFRKNWKRDYNKSQKTLSMQVTDKDMARIRESMAKIVYEEFDSALQEKGGLTKVDQADSSTLLFKPKIINLDVYAPDVDSSYISRSYVRQAGRATLFLEVYDAVSGDILSRWVNTREDPDRGYFDWANRITNADRATHVVRAWAKRLVEGLDDLKAESLADKYLGERKTCLDLVRIKETRILDDQTILFETYGGAVYMSRLPARCVGLRSAGGFSYSTSITKLCKQDIIEIVKQSPFRGSQCGLGEFILIKGVKRLRDAAKRLEDGLLEALIEEDVFEKAFPAEKADEPADRRAWSGLDLFPSLLAADADIAEKKRPDGALHLLLVYQDRQDLAESMRTHLERVTEIQDIPIQVEITGIAGLNDRVEPSLAGIFLVEQAGDAIDTVIRLGREQRAVVFSPFAGDVERGVSSGMITTDRILPYVNVEAMRLSSIRIKPFFLRIAEQYGQ